MSLMYWIAAGLAVCVLAVATWNPSINVTLKAAAVILATASFTIAYTGSWQALALIGVDSLLVVGTWRLSRTPYIRSGWGLVWIGLLVVCLVSSRIPSFQPIVGPAAWIGISYLTFRLIHITLDARRDRLGQIALPDLLVYVLHPATLVAGPIDRAQHSAAEQHREERTLSGYAMDGLWRIFIGLFKKLVIANVLFGYLVQHPLLNSALPPTRLGIILWLVVYSFYIYFDFAGYSDIAIGAARLMGIRVLENFDNPYWQPSLTRFWQAWHITLSTWLRDYIFFPLSRGLIKRFGDRYSLVISFTSHLTTMIVCGLWHGFGSGYLAWGVWHGLGLFLNGQMAALRRQFHLPQIPTVISVIFTFAFVTFGWLFFATTLPQALRILSYLVAR